MCQERFSVPNGVTNGYLILIICCCVSLVNCSKVQQSHIEISPTVKSVQARNSLPLPTIKIPDNWKLINLNDFSFYLPPEVKSVKARRIDSAIWKYIGGNMELTVDFGMYASKPHIYGKEPEYYEEQVKIDDREAVICFFRSSDSNLQSRPYIAAVYFSTMDSKDTKLSFFINGDSSTEQKMARTIFSTIKFHR